MTHKVTEEQASLLEKLVNAVFDNELGAGRCVPKRQGALAQSLHTLRNHRYTSVNWSEVRQQMEGLAQKFLVHAMHKEARMLERQGERLRRGLSADEHLRNSLLAFVFALSNSPVARWAEYADLDSDDSDEGKAVEGAEALTDWHALLMEDIGHLVKVDYAEADEGGSSDDSEQQSDADSDSNAAVPGGGVRRSLPPHHQAPAEPNQPQFQHQQPPAAECHVAYLSSRLQPEYWKAAGGGGCGSGACIERWSQLRLDWLLLDCPAAERIEVTQYQAVRETLWMLSGAKDSTLFTWTIAADGTPAVSVARRVCLPHLTDGAVDCLLGEFAALGTSVARLQHLCERLLSGGSGGPAMSALAGRLHADLLAPLRRDLLLQESESSLLRLNSSLLPWRRAISGATSLMSRVAWSDPEAAARDPAALVRLLDCLERQAMYADLTESQLYAAFAGRAFRLCLRPLLEQLDSLLCGRSAAISLPFLPDPPPAEPPSEPAYWLAPLQVNERAVPRLLRPLMPDLTSAIKSAHLVKVISERRGLPLLWRRVSQAGEASPIHRILDGSTLHACLPETQLAMLRPSSANVEEGPRTYLPTSFCSPTTLPDAEARRLRSQAPLLWRSFQQRSQQQQQQQQQQLGSSVCDPDAAFAPINAVSVRCLQSAIRARCQRVNRLAVEALTGPELRLAEFARFALDLCLMLNRDLLAPLCDLLYRELRAGQATSDELALNLNLRACLAAQPALAPPVFANSVWFTLTPVQISSSSETGLALMEGVSLNCEPPWPLGIVFTESVLETLSQSFRWLLKLRCAKELLERLRFDALRCPEGDQQQGALRYRIYSIRQQLLHLLTAFHQVTMHRLAASASALPARLACCAGGPEELRATLGQFADRCGQVCLVRESGAARIRQILSSLFRYAVVLARRWSSGQLTPATVDTLQAQVDSGKQYFAALVVTLAKNCLAEHLEPLLYAMS